MAATDLWLRDDIRALWQGQDPFNAAFAVQGDVFRALEQRQTLAFTHAGKRYFIKRHRGITWREIFKNLVQGRLPVVSARNEYLALRKLASLGVSVPRLAAYGRRGVTPSAIVSFLVTDDVGAHQSLEDYCRPWREQPPAFGEKQLLIGQLAAIARTLHGAGVCHRDFYLCHFLRTTKDEPLTVIDLHRALIKPALARRWLIKDLAGLYFSALDIGLTRRDLYRFMRQYRDIPLRETLTRDASFWQQVRARAVKLYVKERNGPADLF